MAETRIAALGLWHERSAVPTGYETKGYEIRSGTDALEVRYAVPAQEALFEYMRDQGCRREEIMRLGVNAVSWRGAVYRAEPVSAP